MTQPVDLGTNEGKQVLKSRLSILGVSSGLSDAMQLDPLSITYGERVGIYIEGEMTDLHFPLVKGTDGVARLHVITADVAVVLDTETMRDIVDEHRSRVQQQQEAAAGLQLETLPFPAVDGDEGVHDAEVVE